MNSTLAPSAEHLQRLRKSSHQAIRISSIEKTLFLLTFAAGFLGAMFAINVGFFSFFPFRILLICVFFIFVAHTLIRRGRITRYFKYVRFHLGFVGIWVAYAIFSLAWVYSLEDALRELALLLIGGALIFFAIYYIRTLKDMKWIYWLWMGAFAALIGVGLWEISTGEHLPVSNLHDDVEQRFKFFPTGTFGNQNDYATFLALSFPFAVCGLRYLNNILFRLFCAICGILTIVLIVASASRANILAILLEMAFLWIFLMRIVSKFKGIMFFLVVVVIYIFNSFAMETVLRGIDEASSLINAASYETGSLSSRLNLIKNGLQFLFESAGFGVGVGNAEYWMEYFARYPTLDIVNPHNWWLELLINYGIFIFTGYIIFYLSLIRGLWSVRKKTEGSQRLICDSLLLSLVGFSLASVSSSSITGFNPHWLLFGFALAYLNYARITVGSNAYTSHSSKRLCMQSTHDSH